MYDTVYDAGLVRFPGWPLAAAGVVVALAGALAGLGAFHASGRRGLALRVTRTSLLILGSGWSVFIGVALLAQHVRLQWALRDRAFTVVEGVVYDRPGAASGARHWVVDTPEGAHWYRFESSPLAAGYTRRAPGTGGVTNGARVRIADVRGRIARLEIVPEAHTVDR
jgi:hypothetical protein